MDQCRVQPDMGEGRRWRSVTLLGILAILCALPLTKGTRWAAVAASSAEESPQGAGATYVGSSLCLACHRQESDTLAASGHGKLISDAAAGSAAAGCESCHGAGSEHVGSTGTKPIGQTFAGESATAADAVCGRCHLKEGGGSTGQSWELSARNWARGRHARNGLSCVSCHKVHGGAEHSLTGPADSTCTECHETLVSSSRPYTHKPVADGECTLCHEPHGSGAPYDLAARVGDSCRSCHPSAAPGFVTAHASYSMAESNCTSCHNPHSADRGKALIRTKQHTPFAARRCDLCHSKGPAGQPVLVKPQKELCATCHPASQIMPDKDADGRSIGHHAPVDQGLCTTCHNPHASDHEKQMRAKLDRVCYFCHGDVEEATLTPYEHAPVATGNCLLCHDGHGSAEAHLLTKGPIELCESCHATQGKFTHPVGIKDGRTVRDPNTGDMLVCAGCHAVHGSELPGLLPQDEVQLCRTCHNK